MGCPTTPARSPLQLCRFCGDRSRCRRQRLAVACQWAAARFGTPCARLSLHDGEPVFIVDRSFPQNLRSIDLRAECDPVAAAISWMKNDYHRPIDLVRDRLTDFALLRITDNLSYFYLRAHHVLCDGYGANNWIRHVAAVYSGSVPETAEVDFSEFALIRDADQKISSSLRAVMPMPTTGRPSCGDLWTSPTWEGPGGRWHHATRWCASWCARIDRRRTGMTSSMSQGLSRLWRCSSRKQQDARTLDVAAGFGAHDCGAEKLCGHGVEHGAAAHLRR